MQKVRPAPRIAVLLCFLTALPASAEAFSREDQILADFLIRELRYYDTAMRWLNQERKKTSDKASLAEIDSRRIMCLRLLGKEDEAAREEAAFKKDHPEHIRSAGASWRVSSGR